MDLKEQIIQEYLTQGGGFKKLAAKYSSSMNSSTQKSSSNNNQTTALQQKIAALEKQLEWQKLRADALDTMINVAEKQLNVTIRKKPSM